MTNYPPIMGVYLLTLAMLVQSSVAWVEESGKLDEYGPVTEESYNDMKRTFQQVMDFVRIKENDESAMQKPYNNPKGLGEHKDGAICRSCLWTFTKLHNFLKARHGISIITEFLALICTSTTDYHVCRKIIGLYEPVVTDALLEHYLNAEYICSHRLICENSHFNYLSPDDYARDLLKDKPEVDPIEPDFLAPKWKVLHVTDIHTDLLYSEVSSSSLLVGIERTLYYSFVL